MCVWQLTPHFHCATRPIHRIKVNLGREHIREELSRKNTHTLETKQQAMEMLRQQNSKMLGADEPLSTRGAQEMLH